MQRLGFRDREAFLQWSVEHLKDFWRDLEREIRVEWAVPYTQVLDTSRGVEWAQWFVGGQLNVARNCLERWAERTPERVAILAESEDGRQESWTFSRLNEEAGRLAGVLHRLGLTAGDRVAVCLP